MTNVIILKGEHKGQQAKVVSIKNEFGSTIYELADMQGNKLYNFNYTYFSESWIKPV